MMGGVLIGRRTTGAKEDRPKSMGIPGNQLD